MKGIIEDPRHRWTIVHVTLPYASVRTIGRADIDPNMLEDLRRPCCRRSPRARPLPVPRYPGYRLRPLTMLEGGLVVRLESDAGAELLTTGVGWSDPGAGQVWQEEVTGEVDEPSRLWATDVLSLEVLVRLGDDGLAVARWSGTFARSLAWAALPAPKDAS